MRLAQAVRLALSLIRRLGKPRPRRHDPLRHIVLSPF